jgi:hypothetical protein
MGSPRPAVPVFILLWQNAWQEFAPKTAEARYVGAHRSAAAIAIAAACSDRATARLRSPNVTSVGRSAVKADGGDTFADLIGEVE